MVPWAKLFGLLLIAVVLFIVIVPDDVDLPPTVTPSPHIGFKILPLTVLIHSSIILGLPQNPVAFAVRIVLPDHGDSSGSLIDLNCTRLC